MEKYIKQISQKVRVPTYISTRIYYRIKSRIRWVHAAPRPTETTEGLCIGRL